MFNRVSVEHNLSCALNIKLRLIPIELKVRNWLGLVEFPRNFLENFECLKGIQTFKLIFKVLFKNIQV